MTPRWTRPDPRVDALRGCVAIERGPLVYCFEQTDQPARLDELTAQSARGGRCGERPATLPGIGATIQVSAHGHAPVSAAIAIPYFQWDNRGPARCASGSPPRTPQRSSPKF